MARDKTPANQSKASIVPTEQASPVTSPAQTTPKKHVVYFIECADGIDKVHVEAIESKLQNINNDLLYLVLHTYGGDVYSSVRIMRILQSKFKKIKVIIPDYAYYTGPQKLHSDLRLNYTSLYGSHYTTGSPASI